MLASGWILTENLRVFLELLSAAVGYRFDDSDWGAVEAGFPGTDADDDEAWFEYPLAGDTARLDVAVAEDPGSAVTSYRVAGIPDPLLAARISGYVTVLSSYRLSGPGGAGPVPLRYPHLRAALRYELRKLADRAYQQRVWVDREEPGDGLMADEVMDVAELLSGEIVDLLKPEEVVGLFLHAGTEVAALRALGVVFDALVERLRGQPSAVYLADPAWDDVVRLAAEAERALAAADGSKD